MKSLRTFLFAAVIALLLINLCFRGLAQADYVEERTIQSPGIVTQAIAVVEGTDHENPTVFYVLGQLGRDRSIWICRKQTEAGKLLWSRSFNFDEVFHGTAIGPFEHSFEAIHANHNYIYIAGYILEDPPPDSFTRTGRYVEVILEPEKGDVVTQRILGSDFPLEEWDAITDMHYSENADIYFTRTRMDADGSTISHINGYGQGMSRFYTTYLNGAVCLVRTYNDDVYLFGVPDFLKSKYFAVQYSRGGSFVREKAHYVLHSDLLACSPYLEDAKIDADGAFVVLTSASVYCSKYFDKGFSAGWHWDDRWRNFCVDNWLYVHALDDKLSLRWRKHTVVENPGHDWTAGMRLNLTGKTSPVSAYITLTDTELYITGSTETADVQKNKDDELDITTHFNNYIITFTKCGNRLTQYWFSHRPFYDDPWWIKPPDVDYTWSPMAVRYKRPAWRIGSTEIRNKTMLALAWQETVNSGITLFAIPDVVEIAVDYKAGWNLFSIPVERVYKAEDLPFDMRSIYMYVHGKGYVWIPPWQELKPGYAYWGKLYKSKKFIWSGKENFREYVYFEGFNLASGDYTFNPLTETHECGTLKIWITLGTCTYDTKYSSTQTDNDGNKSYGIPPVVVYGFDLESGGYVQPNVLEPGRGYWTLWHDPDLPIKLEVKK